MKKYVAVLLLVATLLTILSVFSSCATDDSIKESGKISVDLEGYTLLFPDPDEGDVTTTFREQAEGLAERFSFVSGVGVDALYATSAKGVAKKVIVVGQTGNRAVKRLARTIKGDGFAIKVKRNKILIIGSSPVMTMYGMQYLAQRYLAEESASTKVILPRRVRADKLPMMELASSEGTECSFVYDASLDTKEGNLWAEPDNSAQYDYPYAALLDCLGKLATVTELKNTSFVKKADTAPSMDNEIVIGLADRAEVEECLAEIPSEGYGVFVRNGKTLVIGRSDTALSYAHGYFRDLMSDALVKDKKGVVSVRMPVGLALTGLCFEKYVTDFPKPDGVKLYNMQDAGDKSLQYLYMGEGVNADAFHTYCAKLEGEGYVLRTENDIRGSFFATYVNEQTNTTLYVAYNAFSHGEKEFKYKPRLKVISASLDNVAVPDEKFVTPLSTFVKRTDASITALSMVTDAVGMGYVIMLEDGSFIVFDGGQQNDTYQRLVKVLWSLHTRVYGKSPDEKDPLHIAAWVVTHSHSDHYNVFSSFLSVYGNSSYVKIDYIMGNFPSNMAVSNAAGKDTVLIDSMQSFAQRAGKECQYIKIHTGQKYYFPGLDMEVLYTQEDANPMRLNLFNDTSCIVRFTMRAHTADEQGNAVSNAEAKAVTSVWTGDAFIYGSRFTSAMYGDYMKSDMVQVAHHGNIGCESPFYNFVAPTIVWFPHVYNSFWGYTRGTSNAWQYKVDYNLVYGIGSVRYVYVSDEYCVTLPIRASGADYASIYDAITGKGVAYGSRAAVEIVKSA